jgi:hypothetical protein
MARDLAQFHQFVRATHQIELLMLDATPTPAWPSTRNHCDDANLSLSTSEAPTDHNGQPPARKPQVTGVGRRDSNPNPKD